MTSNVEKTLAALRELGTAKIAGLVCNKKAAMTLRIDIEIPKERMQGALDTLGLEATPELLESLEVAIQGLKRHSGVK